MWICVLQIYLVDFMLKSILYITIIPLYVPDLLFVFGNELFKI